MRVSLFLGAGSSAAYGMPTTAGFKDRMEAKCGAGSEWADALASGRDIEEVLTAVMEVAMLPGTRAGRYLESRHPQIKKSVESMKRLEDLIKHEIHEAYSWNPRYNGALDSILSAWLDLIKEYGHDIVVFTTNYDRSVEEYCSHPKRRIRYVDGFELDDTGDYIRWAGMRGDNAWGMSGRGLHMRRLRLLKLHGSLGWKLHESHGPVRVNYEKKSSDPNQRDLLIYPSLSPKSEEKTEPYATIFNHFREQLMSSDACIVVGSSFRDEQIRDEFVQFVEQDKKLVVVSPTGVADIVERVPGSAHYQNPQSRLGPAQHVTAVRVTPADTTLSGRSVALGSARRGLHGRPRYDGIGPKSTLTHKFISGARYGRTGKTIYVIPRAVDVDSILEIASLVRSVLHDRHGYV